MKLVRESSGYTSAMVSGILGGHALADPARKRFDFVMLINAAI
jgi:hypothetical protein